MSSKVTYLYRVDCRKDGQLKEQRYCYARNAKVCKEYYKELFKEKKYNEFNAVAFGTADITRHPGPFEEMPQDEVDYIKKNGIGNGDAYSNRPNDLPAGGQFIPANKEF